MKRLNLLYAVLILLVASCNDEEESAQSKVITLLTDNSAKIWSIYEYFLDEQPTGISPCDSSYILTLNSDFTWVEQYTNFYCYQSNNGQWLLSDDSNVITITYIDWGTGQEVERMFEITELTSQYFSYQYPIRNVLKRIRMQVYN